MPSTQKNVKFTYVSYICQNMWWSYYYVCTYVKTRRSIYIISANLSKLSFWNNLCEYALQSCQNASNGTPDITFAHVQRRSPNSLKWTSWDHLWRRCRQSMIHKTSKEFAFGVHRWDHEDITMCWRSITMCMLMTSQRCCQNNSKIGTQLQHGRTQFQHGRKIFAGTGKAY